MPIEFDSKAFEKSIENMAVRVKSRERKAILAGAEIIKKEIIVLAPEDTGNLKRNIVVSEIQKSTDGTEYVDVGPEKDKAFYGKMLEFGTTKMKAKPFVEPAFIAKRNDVLAVMAEIVKEAIDNV